MCIIGIVSCVIMVVLIGCKGNEWFNHNKGKQALLARARKDMLVLQIPFTLVFFKVKVKASVNT